MNAPRLFSLLVLDDNPKAVHQRIYETLGLLLPEGTLRYSPPWSVSITEEHDIEIRCTFISKVREVDVILLDKEASDKYDLILLDNDWSDDSGNQTYGLELLEKMSALGLRHRMLALYTAADNYEHSFIRRALTAGATALVKKQEPVHLLNLIMAAIELSRLSRLEPALQGALTKIDGRLATSSRGMATCLAEAAAYAIDPEIPILISGATGTGKELIAHAIHKLSPRSAGPFEILDCSTVPSELAESLLFGHEKGAFTGAIASKIGVFERADGGTLFLDEVHAVPLGVQRKLLRVTEYGRFLRVGAVRESSVSVRIIAATNRNLHELVENGSFLPDLYQRLAYGHVMVPALDKRVEDIQAISISILKDFSSRRRKALVSIDDDALAALATHSWRYNVRELKATLERSAALCDGSVIRRADLKFDPLIEPDRDTASRQVSGGLNMGKALAVAPRRGNQRVLFEKLLSNFGKWVSYRDLHSALGENAATDSRASGLLMSRMSILRKRLEAVGFTIEHDARGLDSAGYRMTEQG